MDLNINNLSFRYSKRRGDILSDFHMRLSEGGVCGLLGPNGAGKSTLLYLIAGALTPYRGEVTYEGINTRKRLPQTLSDIFLVPEEVTLPKMSLDKFVELNAPFYPEFDEAVLRECLDSFGIISPGRLDALSMGQKKKVFLSFAFACRTHVLLLDEPTNGLDIPGKATFRSIVARLVGDDRLFIISTHQVRDLDRILDRVLIMDTHRIVLNESIVSIQDHLLFARNVNPCPADALRALPAPGGFDVMLPNREGRETEVNLELLFDFAINDRERAASIFS